MQRDYKKEYELWWKYLKLSEDYEEFCRFMARYQADPNVPIPEKFKRLGIPKEELLAFTCDDLRIEVDKEEGAPTGYTPHTYLTFGDVHNTSFNDWWESTGKFLPDKKEKSYIDKPLSSFEDHFEGITYWFENFLKRNKGREPSYYDFKNYLSKSIECKKPYRHFICVNLLNPIGDIKKEFGRFIDDHKKDIPPVPLNEKYQEWFSCRNRIPTPNFRFDRFEILERYYGVLKIFKSGKRGKEAFNIYKQDPDGNYYSSTQRNIFYSHKKRGLRILRNVEKGFFPGLYE